MRHENRKGIGAAFLLTVGLALLAAPVVAQGGECPQCRTFEDGKKRVEATLRQIETELEKTQQHLEQVRKARADRQAGEAASAERGSEVESVLDDMTSEEESHDLDRINRLNRAKDWYEDELNRLDAALGRCARQGCPGEGGAWKPVVGPAAGIDIWHLASPCPHCEKLQDRIEWLEREIWSGEYVIPFSQSPGPAPHATSGKSAMERMREADRRSDYERQRQPLIDEQQRLVNRVTDPNTSAEDRLAATRELKQNHERIKELDREIEASDDKLDMLDELDDLRQQIKDCQEEQCAPPAEESQSSAKPGVGVYVGVSGWFTAWDHPETAVKETLDSIDAPPGATKSSSSDTSAVAAAAELGVRIPLVVTPNWIWWLDGGVTLADGTELSGTAVVDALAADGTPLTARVRYEFDTGKPVAVDLTAYVLRENGFFFQAGPTYLDVPMNLKTIETFLVNGELVNEMTSEDEIHDSAVGFKVAIGWSGKHSEIVAGYRQATINEADMKIAHLGLRFKF